MDYAQALQYFWSSFGIPAYDELTTPDKATEPYITYEVQEAETFNTVNLTANLWYKSKSWSEITKKSKEIKEYIGLGGVTIQTDNGGVIWIKCSTPFAIRMEEPTDKSIRRIVINIEVEFLTK